MQLLFHPDKKKTIAPKSWGKKFILVILLLLHVHVNNGVNAERICYQCNGINCLRTSYEFTQKCLNDLDICVTVFDGQTVLAQGCLEQLPEKLRTKCEDKVYSESQTEDSEELNECFKCNNLLCNNLGSSSFECIQCDSDNDENCRSNPQSLVPSRCGISRTPNEYCFVKSEGQRTIRGCSNTLEDQQTCLLSTDCMICEPSELKGCNGLREKAIDDNGSGDEGNGDTGSNGGSEGENTGNDESETGLEDNPKLICHQCNGINCLRTSYQVHQECLNYLDICVTVFDGQTVLAQGCLEQLTEDLRNKCDDEAETDGELSECIKCNANLCNNMASKSFECVQCDSENDENCRDNPSILIPARCGISRTLNEYCFVKKEGDHVIRGCSNTLEEQLSCLSSDDCMICQPSELRGCNGLSEIVIDDNGSGGEGNGNNGSNGGSGGENTGDTESGSEDNSKRICHQCNGINCLRTSYQVNQECLNNLDICVTVFDGQTVLAQGCLEQLTEDLRNKCNDGLETDGELRECVKCNENLCNNMASKSFECIQCDSEKDENCRNNPTTLIPSRCNISRTPNEYCFVKQEGERVIRGCSYTLEEQLLCLSSNECTICQPSELSSCNDVYTKDDNGEGEDGSGSGPGDGGSGSESGSGGGTGGNNPSDGGSGSGSGDGSGGDGGSSGSGGNKPNDNGSDSGSGDGGSSGSGGNKPNDNGSGSGSGDGGSSGSGGNKPSDNGSGSGSGNGGSDSGSSGDGSNGSENGNSGGSSNNGKTSVVYSQIFIFIINIIVVYFVTK